jgi:hypothetical protein
MVPSDEPKLVRGATPYNSAPQLQPCGDSVNISLQSPAPQNASVLGSIDGFKTFTPNSKPLREHISDVGAIKGPKISDGCLTPFFKDLGSTLIRQHRKIDMHNDLREIARAQSSLSRREIGDTSEVERQSEIAMAAPPQTIMREV